MGTTRFLLRLMCAATLLALVVPVALGAEPAGVKTGPDLKRLPDSLDHIKGNILDLEQGDRFTVTQVRYGPVGHDHDQAVIWTLRANRQMSWRHVETFLRGFRDVRFYAFGRNDGRPSFSTLLFYRIGVAADAINGEYLPAGGTMEVWFFLSRNERMRLIGGKADTMVLGRAKKRRT